MADDYQFDDLDSIASELGEDSESKTETEVKAEVVADPVAAPVADPVAAPQSKGGSGGGAYATELFSKKIEAKFRTFFIDLKESSNGKFVKISEKSHGRKSTVMMDAEDVSVFIEALQEVQSHL